jgi:AraC-like DNA-binding protein
MRTLPGLDGFSQVAAFLQILGLVAEGDAKDIQPLASMPFSMTGAAAHQEAIRDAVSYILAHYREPIAISELLRLTNMSRPTFTRQFRRHTGKSFSDFHNHVRLQAVCRALRLPGETVSGIALNHGFNQLSFFNRLFRRKIGVNPTEYRAGLGTQLE